MILIVWDTVGETFPGPLEVYWAGPGKGDGDVDGWTVHLSRARAYPSRDEADHDLRAARETVQRGVQRGSVDVQELS